MLPLPTGREANTGKSAPPYARHRPERTLLYHLIEKYYPVFEAHCAVEDRILPDYVRQEFEDYLKCGRLEHGFLRVRCDACHAEHLVAFSCKRRGLLRASCPTPFGPAIGSSNRSRRFCEPLDFMYRMYGMPRAQEALERPSQDWPPWCRSRA